MRDDREEGLRSETTSVEERVETRTPGDPVGPPHGEPEVEQAVVRENEVVRQREDGAIERDTVREERRRRSRGGQIGIALAILALLAAAAFGAWWYFTQASTTEVPAVEGMSIPAETPAAVTTSPLSTNRSSGRTSIVGSVSASRSREPQ